MDSWQNFENAYKAGTDLLAQYPEKGRNNVAGFTVGPDSAEKTTQTKIDETATQLKNSGLVVAADASAYESARSISVVADALAEELDYSAFDAAILPGGIPGVDNLKADATVRKVCTEFAAAGKVVAAICAAPSVLAAFGILQGKKATVYPGMEDKLTAAGAEYTGLPITLDGNIITGEALGAAIPFALALASRLAGQQASNAVKQGIVYRY